MNIHVNSMNTPVSCLKIAHAGIKSRRHFRLVRGKLQNAIRHLPAEAQGASLRVFDSVAKKYGNFERY